jgi:predicted DNA-binding transcriptional regulator YafY
MDNKDVKRIARLTAILTQLQTKRMITATELASKFSVSIRTIYRDIKTLEQAGVPIVTEEGQGYRLMESYRLPPVMFAENEANALILAEQLVLKNRDSSLVKDYSAAIDKVKAVLNHQAKDKANILTERTHFDQVKNKERTSSKLSTLQLALTNFLLTKIDYVN